MDNIQLADYRQVALAIEEGYEFGFFPFYWELYVEDKQQVHVFIEDIADMVWQGVIKHHIPCNWELKILTEL